MGKGTEKEFIMWVTLCWVVLVMVIIFSAEESFGDVLCNVFHSMVVQCKE